MSRSGGVNVFVVCVEAERPSGTDRYCDSVYFDEEKANEQAEKIVSQMRRVRVERVPLMDADKIEAARKSIVAERSAQPTRRKGEAPVSWCLAVEEDFSGKRRMGVRLGQTTYFPGSCVQWLLFSWLLLTSRLRGRVRFQRQTVHQEPVEAYNTDCGARG